MAAIPIWLSKALQDTRTTISGTYDSASFVNASQFIDQLNYNITNLFVKTPNVSSDIWYTQVMSLLNAATAKNDDLQLQAQQMQGTANAVVAQTNAKAARDQNNVLNILRQTITTARAKGEGWTGTNGKQPQTSSGTVAAPNVTPSAGGGSDLSEKPKGFPTWGYAVGAVLIISTIVFLYYNNSQQKPL